MRPRGERAKHFLLGLLKLLALVLAAGGVGAAIGVGLTTLSQHDDAAAPVADASATATVPLTSTGVAATQPPTSTAPPPVPPPTATATPAPAPGPASRVRLKVLDARLFTDDTPSGARAQRARVTVRIRAENTGTARRTLSRPILRVGSVRIPTDPAADRPGSQFGPLRPGVKQTVTLRFSLAGEATPKVVRDRRARVLIAGQSIPMRLKLRSPTG